MDRSKDDERPKLIGDGRPPSKDDWLTVEDGFLHAPVDLVPGVDLQDRYRIGGPKEHKLLERLNRRWPERLPTE